MNDLSSSVCMLCSHTVLPIQLKCLPRDEHYSIKQSQSLIPNNVWQMHSINHHAQHLRFFISMQESKQALSMIHGSHSLMTKRRMEGRRLVLLEIYYIMHTTDMLINCLCKFNSSHKFYVFQHIFFRLQIRP